MAGLPIDHPTTEPRTYTHYAITLRSSAEEVQKALGFADEDQKWRNLKAHLKDVHDEMCKKEGYWKNPDCSFTALPDKEVKEARRRLTEKCLSLIGSDVSENTLRQCMENRFCSIRRSWQQRLKQTLTPRTLDRIMPALNLLTMVGATESPGIDSDAQKISKDGLDVDPMRIESIISPQDEGSI